ncbi:SRPBCC family protein [Paractinoplanes rishiriensis]|uniref:Polyketide cyclase/dehydrase n=1 Tax=Paractinoplanes rishiriensis TaxID=1050105 RepID=A0A919JT71_9ACTN|nr:SRPBCC family protein [Actinoplanes rishiriensis]GIE93029.1 hypothetical protein Ari01nite_04940 [Actinoplanes rishiriensis]
MTTAFTATETVDRPAAEVWAHLNTWTWMPGVEDVRVRGSELGFRARGRERTARLEVPDDGRTVIVHSRQGGVTAAYTYHCVPDGDRTRLTLIADVAVAGGFRPFAGLLRYAIRRADGGQLAALKRSLAAV